MDHSTSRYIAVLLVFVPLATTTDWLRPQTLPKINNLEVLCGTQHMEVQLDFSSEFQGMVAAKGQAGTQGCVYVPPRTGKKNFRFTIYYDKCGTKPDLNGKFFEQTLIIQYDEELIEAWDEAKRLRCEWFNDYEKTATKTSPMVIGDLDIVELNFHGDNVDCWMEIQEGKGPWGNALSGIVQLGSPLTMVVAVKDPTGEFDMRVKACEASDGLGGHVLPLSDVDGCILRPKLIGKFSKLKVDDGRATVLTYAHISAFKFPDVLNVHLRCTVEICRHGCVDHCQNALESNRIEIESVRGSIPSGRPAIPTPLNFPPMSHHLVLGGGPQRTRRSTSSQVHTTFRVVSQSDLNFPLNSTNQQEQITRGKMTAPVLYGICLPTTTFSVVFFGLGLAALVTVATAGFLSFVSLNGKSMGGMGSRVWVGVM